MTINGLLNGLPMVTIDRSKESVAKAFFRALCLMIVKQVEARLRVESLATASGASCLSGPHLDPDRLPLLYARSTEASCRIVSKHSLKKLSYANVVPRLLARGFRDSDDRSSAPLTPGFDHQKGQEIAALVLDYKRVTAKRYPITQSVTRAKRSFSDPGPKLGP